MNKKREAVTRYLVYESLAGFTFNTINRDKYKAELDRKTDAEFDAMMLACRDNGFILPLYLTNGEENTTDVDELLRWSDSLGLLPFQRLTIVGEPGMPDYTPPNRYLILKLPNRRQAQSILKKLSVPTNDRVLNQATGQVTGDSKGSSLSLPEIRVLLGIGATRSLEELIRVRGGDKGSYAAYNASVAQIGSVSLERISPYATGVESAKYVNVLFMGMHIKANL